MQGNEELKKRQILSAQIDLSKFNKGRFYKGNGRREEAAGCHGRVNDIF